ncbi:hypothetical protein [Dysgonomonas sp. 520]|uniref:hypothetical protein n=1 Tax=Dysgonomonas sp. 520 TaxID=2302931 RepID=UPI0013D894B0|nr:hypothetical protein [Dysgonomonas sp. 520]NDW09973.1 hypothetical protein [Dysgonomonas sp. 520]
MNIKTKMKIAAAILMIFTVNISINAQVTVGSDNPAAKAALLEIKSEETTNPTSVTDVTNVTSRTGGLGLPRVQLVNTGTLEPFIATTATEWSAGNKALTMIKHAGLMVYNLSLTNGFKQGIYVWDGAQWVIVKDDNSGASAERYFYIPSFNIGLGSVGATSTVNLYEEYRKQFTKAGNSTFVSNNASLNVVPSAGPGVLYTPDQLDYVVTYYDTDIFDTVSINNSGVMTYKVKSLNTTPGSYLNVVFVVKE